MHNIKLVDKFRPILGILAIVYLKYAVKCRDYHSEKKEESRLLTSL